MAEEIRELLEYPGYGVSRDGRVWSRRVEGKGLSAIWKSRPLTPRFHKRYLWVGLNLSGKKTWRAVHVLLFSAWVNPIPKGMQIDHLDCNPLNNDLSNLELVTHSENRIRAQKHGRQPSKVGDLNPNSNFRKALRLGKEIPA